MARKEISNTTHKLKIVTSPLKTSVIGKKISPKDKVNRRMILSINVFLLRQDKMKKTYWTIASCGYKMRENELMIGVTTVDGKMGTTLKNMRSHALELSHFIKDQGLTPKVPRIVFYVYKQDEEDYLDKLNTLIDSVELDLKLNSES
jgi:hypothetical protein